MSSTYRLYMLPKHTQTKARLNTPVGLSCLAQDTAGLSLQLYVFLLCASISTINSEISTSNVQTGITKQECDWAHQIFWSTHLTHWN